MQELKSSIAATMVSGISVAIAEMQDARDGRCIVEPEPVADGDEGSSSVPSQNQVPDTDFTSSGNCRGVGNFAGNSWVFVLPRFGIGCSLS